MLHSFYNFIISKLYPNNQQGVQRKRRLEEDRINEDLGPPRKLARVAQFPRMEDDIEVVAVRLSASKLLNKENKRGNGDEECRIIDEVHPTGQILGRRSIKPNASSTPFLVKPKLKTDERKRLPLTPSQSQQVKDDEIEVVKQVRYIPSKRSQPSTSRDNIFHSFKKSTLHNTIRKQMKSPRNKFGGSFFKNEVSKTWKLNEKSQYSKILSIYIPQYNLMDFQPKDVSLRKAIMPAIPVIDLEKTNPVVKRDQELTLRTKPVAGSESDEIVLLGEKISKSPPIQRVNSLQDFLKTYKVTSPNYITDIVETHSKNVANKQRLVQIEEEKAKLYFEQNKTLFDDSLVERLKNYMKVTEPVVEEEEEEEEYTLPELTTSMLKSIDHSLKPKPDNEVLVNKFDIAIKRKDLFTLANLNWLNDEVINFYMNLLIDRSKNNDKLPKVHAFSTFFLSNLTNRGYAGVKRWTKKINVFEKDLLVVPVHLGVHWCMAIIDFRSKEIRYYDSMGNPNNKCLNLLKMYLEEESKDKQKVAYDTSTWNFLNMGQIPQQMNGSDCGMFACTFAEHICRNSPLRFSQDHMPYFRKKMAYEIVNAKLLT